MKKIIAMMMVLMMMAGVSACKSNGGKFNPTGDITVTSREDGSGTRGAFIELFKIEQKNESGEKIDRTTDEALITNSTAVMMTTVAGNAQSIGYISLGSLNDTVKALKIDGEVASAENIINGKYKISRPFNIATKGEVSAVAKDFMDYIMSDEGQKIVAKNGYISVGNKEPYSGTRPAGKVVVAGSSSVSPVMAKLKEAYAQINPNATVEIQENDSTTGMISLADGICDIGMASRELKDSEKSKGITATAIAMDGIAVIVNKENSYENLTGAQIAKIFMRETVSWGEIK
ncbi:MAG: substrate-binding domain-containing protein [Oscillospiraceae bacterium]